jgi:hypothetical protein
MVMARIQKTEKQIRSKKHVLDANTLPRALAERDEVFLQPLPLCRVKPSLRDIAIRVREYEFIVMHHQRCHANRSLIRREAHVASSERKSIYPWGDGVFVELQSLIRCDTL